MKKKGFTLVELLAVIAILAILVIVAVPQVMGQFRKAKKSTFATEAQDIIKGSATQLVMDEMENGSATVTYTNIGGSTKPLTTMDISDDKHYSVVYSAGKITSFVLYNASYCISSTGTDLKATDIKEANIKVHDGSDGASGCASSTLAE